MSQLTSVSTSNRRRANVTPSVHVTSRIMTMPMMEFAGRRFACPGGPVLSSLLHSTGSAYRVSWLRPLCVSFDLSNRTRTRSLGRFSFMEANPPFRCDAMPKDKESIRPRTVLVHAACCTKCSAGQTRATTPAGLGSLIP